MTFTERRQSYRRLLLSTDCFHPASVFDPVSARLAEACGFEIGMLAGSVAAATVLGAPDIVVLTLSEFAEQARRIVRVGTLPVMVDADHGYGNALSVMRTVQELECAGVAALTIEDTRLPRQFGQGQKDEFISEAEFAGKLGAAVAARQDPEFVILGRSGVLSSQGTEGVAARIRVCEAAGVDGVFVTGIKSREEVTSIHQMTSLPIVLGTIPPALHDRAFLSSHGVRIALQGHIPFQMAIKALHQAYEHLRQGGSPAELKEHAASSEVMNRVLDQARYRDWADKYLT